MKKYKFKELDKGARDIAIIDYLNGWRETHDESIDSDDVVEILLDNNDNFFYTKKGIYIGDSL